MICGAVVDMLGVCGFDTSLLCTFFLSFRLVQVIGVIDVVFFFLLSFFLPSFLFLPLQNADRGLDRGVSDPSPFFSRPVGRSLPVTRCSISSESNSRERVEINPYRGW